LIGQYGLILVYHIAHNISKPIFYIFLFNSLFLSCFELSRQPHSINCKQFFNQNNRNIYTNPTEFKNQRRSNSNMNINNRSNVSSLNSYNSKSKQSEYQSSFMNNNGETKQTTKV
jgi:hypothetical protein